MECRRDAPDDCRRRVVIRVGLGSVIERQRVQGCDPTGTPPAADHNDDEAAGPAGGTAPHAAVTTGKMEL
jgi:hypothetical protein